MTQTVLNVDKYLSTTYFSTQNPQLNKHSFLNFYSILHGNPLDVTPGFRFEKFESFGLKFAVDVSEDGMVRISTRRCHMH